MGTTDTNETAMKIGANGNQNRFGNRNGNWSRDENNESMTTRSRRLPPPQQPPPLLLICRRRRRRRRRRSQPKQRWLRDIYVSFFQQTLATSNNSIHYRRAIVVYTEGGLEWDYRSMLAWEQVAGTLNRFFTSISVCILRL